MKVEINWRNLDRLSLSKLLYENVTRGIDMTIKARNNLKNYYSCCNLETLHSKVVELCNGKLYEIKGVKVTHDKPPPVPLKQNKGFTAKRGLNTDAQIWKDHDAKTLLMSKPWIKAVTVIYEGFIGIRLTDIKYKERCVKLLQDYNGEVIING